MLGPVLLEVVPPGLLPAREQMALSLGWHIILACFGVAFPTMIGTMHLRGLRGDRQAMVLTERWAKSSSVLFAIGAVSGTVLSFEMGLLWPGLMGRFGDVLGLPFALEGLSFFVEAIFLGIYLYGFNRLRPRLHLLTLLPMALAGIFGTFCVVSANAWMNDPTGFTLVDGKVTDVHPWRAMFNDRAGLEFLHMWVGAFMVVGFIVAGVYAAGMLKGRRDRHHRLGFMTGFGFASVAAVIQPVVGHILGLPLGTIQPSKLAAFELALTTEQPAPLTIGGILVGGHVKWALKIPMIGSLIARGSLSKPVVGLDTIPAQDRPPVNITHLAFQSMVGIGSLLALVVVGYWLTRRFLHRDLLLNRWFLRLCVLAAVLAPLALELGWTSTEVGRQPWTAFGVLRTNQAASWSTGLWWSYAGVAVIYALLTVGAVLVLRSMARRWRRGEEDLPSPYAPEAPVEEAER